MIRPIALIGAAVLVGGAVAIVFGATGLVVPLVLVLVMLVFIGGGNLLHGPTPHGRPPRPSPFAEKPADGAPGPDDPAHEIS